MTADRWERVKEIFEAALDSDPRDRDSFLEEACPDDVELRAEVARLLSSFEKVGTFLSEPAADLRHSLVAGDVIGDRYRIVGLLGRGGMGEVYEARDEFLKETIALKTLRLDLGQDARLSRRFRKEIQLARKVTHPNVCRVLEVGVHAFSDPARAPLHYFTMQLLKGETLADRIQRTGKIPAKEAFPLIAGMAEGLQAAHDQGIIHRDFKSANVILTENKAVITDFGLAGSFEIGGQANSVESFTEITQQVAGTIAYMSPEQMSGGPVTAASDIYSLGVVLFEMATGQRPYESEQIIRSAMQRATGQIPSVRALDPGVDPRMESAIERCLQKEPSKRFRAASEIATLFREDHWKLPRVYWTRREWAKVVAAGAVAVGAGSSYWYWSRRPYQPNLQALNWYTQGIDAFRVGTYEKARRTLEQAIDTDRRYAPAYAYLATVYNELDATERAKEAMLQAIQLQQDQRWTDADSMRVKGMQYAILRDFERAQALFVALAEMASGHEKSGAYLDLAWLALRRENPGDRERALNKVLELNPQDPAGKVQIAQVYARQRKLEAAEAAFRSAETWFTVGGNYDGVTETLLQHAIALGRMNKTADSIQLIQRGLTVAETTRDEYHKIRLRLALALAYRNTGEIRLSQAAAEDALKNAVDNKMDTIAAIGLIDLGMGYFLRGEPKPAEQYFLQGLESAQRGRGLFSEARAKLLLGSLTLEYDRPMETLKWAGASLPFFSNGGYLREETQNLLVLGGAQNTLAKFEEAEKTLRRSLQIAEQIRDNEQSGIVHAYLGEGFADPGKWPAAVAEQDQALRLYGEIRGGYRAAFAYCFRARIWARLGRFQEAEGDLAQARSRVDKLEGEQAQLKSRLALCETEIAYFQARWRDALKFARKASAMDGGAGENLEAEMWAGLSLIQLGSVAEGSAACQRALDASREKFHEYSYGADRQFLAEALLSAGLADQARRYAQEALVFFEAHECWEGNWRSRSVLSETGDPELNQVAGKLKQAWPAEMIQSYAHRADLKFISQKVQFFL